MVDKLRTIYSEGQWVADIPAGLPRAEVPSYLCSQTYKRQAALYMPRREVLVGIAAIAVYSLLPTKAAQAAPLAATLTAIQLGIGAATAAWELGRRVMGEIQGNSPSKDAKKGTINFIIYAENDEVEDGTVLEYTVPPDTDFAFTFRRGPRPKEEGWKTLSGQSAMNDVHTDFEAIG